MTGDSGYYLAHAWALWLLVPLTILWWLPRRVSAGILFGPANLLPGNARNSQRPLLWRLLMSLGWCALAVAVARPQWGFDRIERDEQGRDLMLVLDLSLSMIADDQPDRTDRLRAVISAASAFIERRAGDRIGLVFFATDAALGAPLTFDHQYLQQQLRQTEEKQRAAWQTGLRQRTQPVGLLENGTNLGLALGIAAGALTDDTAPGRAIIMITDGRDSRDIANWVDPITAARHARALDQTVYCIGVGNPEGDMRDLSALIRYGLQRRIPITNQYLPDLDRLQDIASTGGGIALAAGDEAELKEMLQKIEELEPGSNDVTVIKEREDRFIWPLLIGLIIMSLGIATEPLWRGPLV